MKRIIVMLSMIMGFNVSIDAKLHIRNNYFGDRVERYSERPMRCCVERRGWYEPHSVADAEDEVNRLRMQVIDKYDSGEYVAGMQGWGQDRQRALDIQTKLGYTVPERFTWGD